MVSGSSEFENILVSIDRAIQPSYLSPTQEIVLRETWNGKTYSQIANQHNYDAEYIKTVGCNLWQVLSNAFNRQINKNNFVPYMRQEVSSPADIKIVSTTDFEVDSVQAESERLDFWNTAPKTNSFVGREEELTTLDSWVQSSDCRCIIVSGMVGCGKTFLITRLAELSKDKFERVIWLSFNQAPPIKKFLYNSLNLVKGNLAEKEQIPLTEINLLLAEFVNLLKQIKTLLVIDGLQNIFDRRQNETVYKDFYQEYGQLLRAIITSNHNSLLVTSSRIRPSMLEYYSNNQVKFLDLKGLNLPSTKKFLNTESKNYLFDEQQVSSLHLNLQSNPKMLKVVQNYLDKLSLSGVEYILRDLSLLEEIASLLEEELEQLSDLSREIICWLAICDNPILLEDLWQNIESSFPKTKFLYSVDFLAKRSLILESDRHYHLLPVMKSYLRRKLVKNVTQDY